MIPKGFIQLLLPKCVLSGTFAGMRGECMAP